MLPWGSCAAPVASAWTSQPTAQAKNAESPRVHHAQAQGQRPGQGDGEDGVQERGAGQAAAADQRGVSWVDRVAVSCAFSAKKIAAP